MTRKVCRNCRKHEEIPDGKDLVHLGKLCQPCKDRLKRLKRKLLPKVNPMATPVAEGVQMTFTYHCILCGEVTDGHALCTDCSEECG